MAARGAESKNIITEKILETFEGSFKYDKEIRVPIIENGEEIQIKIVLTAAKTNVAAGGDTALPGTKTVVTGMTESGFETKTVDAIEPTAEEKSRVADLFESLGL